MSNPFDPAIRPPSVPPSHPPINPWKVAAWLVGGAAVGAAGAFALANVIEALTEDPERKAIRQSAEKHLARGAEVFADIPGWPRPPVIFGRIPDIYAKYPNGRVKIEEFENDSSVSSTHANAQDRAFTRWVNMSVRFSYTQIIVDGGRGGRG